ncbi:hypothetical protein J4444_01725 [Candidatus Woesearchaeota archaeon]|nr:hypothetical protein [Candidatus Woesearchaeota archaeon]
MIKKLLPFIFSLFLIKNVSAHCPLCTAGAAVAVGGAVYLGVSPIVIGLFIGAFAVSLGWWVSKYLKKRYIPFQRTIIVVLSFLLTVIPIMPLAKGFYPLQITLFGDYGSLFNRMYLVNLFLFGSILGGLIVCITPWLSNKVTIKRGKTFPFQGVILTFLILLIFGGLFEVIKRLI